MTQVRQLHPHVPLVAVGDIIAGKFRVERVLGEGGTGVVVAAEHLELKQRVALKVLKLEAATTPDVFARFAEEARATAKLQSENVARVLDVGELVDGTPFLVMEYLEGEDLAAIVAQRGRLPIEDAAEYVVQACAGLAEAHACDIVHRDVKPANLFLVAGEGGPTVKIVDFGISNAALGPSDVSATGGPATVILGSPCYMSPEQLRSAWNVDHRADLWSLGTVLFELVTGHTPFDVDLPLSELVRAILDQPPRALGHFVADPPAGLEEVVARCLDKDRRRRFQNAAELAIALLPFAPKRARLAAARATSVTRASGLSDADLEMPPSEAPPPPRLSADSGLLALATSVPSIPALRSLSPESISIRIAAAASGDPEEDTQPSIPPPSKPKAPSRVTRRVAPALALGLTLGVLMTLGVATKRRPTSAAAPVGAVVAVPMAALPASTAAMPAMVGIVPRTADPPNGSVLVALAVSSSAPPPRPQAAKSANAPDADAPAPPPASLIGTPP